MNNIADQVVEYMKQPYTLCFIREEDPSGFTGYSSMVLELPGCFSQGETIVEAENSLKDAMYGWLEATIEKGQSVPPPADHKEIMKWQAQREPKP